MPDLFVKAISNEVFAGLLSLAEAHGSSPEEEAKAILEQEVAKKDRAALVEELRAFRSSLGPGPFTDSSEILKELREDRLR